MKRTTLSRTLHISLLGLSLIGSSLLAGCGPGEAQPTKKTFFTSGNNEADQRADQRMAKENQLKQSGGSNVLAPKDQPKSLFDRIGGDAKITDIVDDFTARLLADPRVNFERKGIKQGGLSFHRSNPVTKWTDDPSNVATLKKHMAQFLALATGGPVKYEGRQMAQAHAGMKISNDEFDAAIGDMKASLDKLLVGDKEQKELLSILESTRGQIVEQR